MAFDKVTVGGVELTKHPVMTLPTEEQVIELAKELVALKELVKELKAEVDELKKAK